MTNNITPEDLLWNERLIILKLYGSLEYPDSSFILTEDDHIDYSLNSLQHILKISPSTSRSILFLGYSMNDYDLRDIYRQVPTKSVIQGKRYYILQSTKSGDLMPTPLGKSNLEEFNSTLENFLEKMKHEFLLM